MTPHAEREGYAHWRFLQYVLQRPSFSRGAMPHKQYDDLTKDELVRLLQARDRRDATRFGLVWEANEIERERALNQDFVALDLDAAHSAGPGPWRNLIIEGDNFDALRYLRMTMAGKVKCIYIDPPYNTGNRDFIYNDRFVDKEDLWRHSKWCEFMFQRLTLARDLLAQDGAIFVSIDDNEMAALRLLMNAVFREANFVASFVWKKVDSPNDNKVPITPDHESIVCFTAGSTKFSQMSAPNILDAYGSTDESGRRFRDRLLKKNGKNSLRKDRPTMFFPLNDPDGNEVLPIHDNGEEACWAMGRDGVAKHQKNNTLVWKRRQRRGNEVWEPYTREFAPETPTRPYPTIWSDLPTMRQAKAMLRGIFDTADLFSTPKPIELIERIIRMCTGPDDLIVDFFAGSGTTAHAVLKMNAEDGGNRRFILVSNTEATADEPEKNLCRDVCATRVRRVIAGYGDVPGLGGDFAYLKCRRIAPGDLMEIDHAQVWTALQLTHCETLANPCTHHAPRDARVTRSVTDTGPKSKPHVLSEALVTRSVTDTGPENIQPAVGDEFIFVAGNEEQLLVYVPHLRRGVLGPLRQAVRTATAVVVYAWQPDLVRQRLANEPHVQVEAVPESLARRFGLRV